MSYGNYPEGISSYPNLPWNYVEVECDGENHIWNDFGECEGCDARQCFGKHPNGKYCCEGVAEASETGHCRECEIRTLKEAIAYELAQPSPSGDLVQYQEELEIWLKGGTVVYA